MSLAVGLFGTLFTWNGPFAAVLFVTFLFLLILGKFYYLIQDAHAARLREIIQEKLRKDYHDGLITLEEADANSSSI